MNGVDLGHRGGKNISGRNPVCLIKKATIRVPGLALGLALQEAFQS